MGTRKLITVPNMLSFYRILSFPLVLYYIIDHRETTFVVLLIVNLITDFLDGFIARKYHLETDFGAQLDSLADNGTYVLAFIGLFLFKANDLLPHMISFLTFMSLFALSVIISLVKFKRFPSLHLYSWKVGGYLQGSFFFVLFIFGFISVLYNFMIIWGIAAFSEHIIIQIISPEMKSNAKGLYWVLKDK